MTTSTYRLAVGLGALAMLVAGCGSKGSSGGSGGASTATNTFPTTTNTSPVTTASQGVPGVSSLGTGRAYHTATALPSGGVFVAGGVDAAGTALNLTAIVTPTSVTQGPTLMAARYGHTATLLGNGEILIAGGQTSSTGGSALATTEIYNPAANAVTAGPNLSTARSDAVAIAFGPIGSQQVMIAGGSNGSTILGTVEVYNVNTNVMSTLQAPLAQARSGASAGLMDDGTIVIVGGTSTVGLAGAEIFTPSLGTFQATTMPIPVAGGAFTSDGSEAVLAGGQTASAAFEQSTMVYELGTRVFSQGPQLSIARRDATASVLNGSQVVIVGGRSATGVVGNVEVFSGPTMAQSTISPGSPLQAPRYGHTATVVNNQILVIGGFDSTSTPISSVEIVTAGGTTVSGSTVGPTAPGAPLGVPMSIIPVPSTSVIPAATQTPSTTSSFLSGLLSGFLGNLLGTSTPTTATAGLVPAITSTTPTTGSGGTLVVVQATGIGAYLSVSFNDGSGTPVFLDATNCTAYQNGASVQVSLTVPASLAAGTYEIDLVTSSYSTAGSPAAMAQTSFTVQ